MRINYTKIIQLILILVFITVMVALLPFSVSKVFEIICENKAPSANAVSENAVKETVVQETETDLESNPIPGQAPSVEPSQNFPAGGSVGAPSSKISTNLIGGFLNSTLPESEYTFYASGFYYAPLSENLRKYMMGRSFPRTDIGEQADISLDALCYVHVLHIDFEGNEREGELVCNKAIAQDLVEIFMELYLNRYEIEKITLIDDYYGDDALSMEDNNSSCFNYRTRTNMDAPSVHSYGLAIDINPVYNPYVTNDRYGNLRVIPEDSYAYADRDKDFSHKIEESDLCCQLFTEHGFIWGGSWNSSKDYQHFEKTAAN